MYAVIAAGGKQYRVAEGQRVKIELMTAEVGASVEFPALMISNGEQVQIGAPFLAGKVSAEVVGHGRGEKIRIVKHRRRKHYHREMGHRQYFTEIQITKI